MTEQLLAIVRGIADENVRNELMRLHRMAREAYIPIMDDDGAVAMVKALRDKQPKRILEIGTAIGYSGLLALAVCDEARLTTIDIDWDRVSVAQEAFGHAQVSHRVQCVVEDAQYALSLMSAQYDWILLDGPKGQYGAMWSDVMRLLAKDGQVWVDDVDYLGLVDGNDYPIHKHRTIVVNMRKWLEQVTKDETLVVQRKEGKAGALLIKRK